MGDAETLARVVDIYAWQRQAAEDRITQQARKALARFGGWYSPAQVERMAELVGVQVSAGQRSIAGLTDTYMSRMAREVFNETVPAVGVPDWMGKTLRLNVSGHVEVYSRLGAEYRRLSAAGMPSERALSATLNRADEMVSTDLGLAARDQSSRFVQQRNIKRYRRVTRPELSKGTCGLCIAASTRIYRRADLMPLHARCKCVVVAMSPADLGDTLNKDVLAAAYGDAEGLDAASLKRVRVKVVQHGELGPQLRDASHNFRGPDQLAA